MNAFDTAISDKKIPIRKVDNDVLDNRIKYQQNEIGRMTDSDKADYDRIKEEISNPASMKYKNIRYTCSDRQSYKITELLNSYVPDGKNRSEFLEHCTKNICIGQDGIMRIELIDGFVLTADIERKIKNDRENDNRYSGTKDNG